MKPRARDLNIQFGQLQPGPLNAITDVPGVRVGHSNVRGRTANGRDILTGVTVIEPRAGSTSLQPVCRRPCAQRQRQRRRDRS